ncbi:U-box domain-containing protein 7-like [Typha latifolia]|uniref:U-box domain-containing protein 7-like n=1 Tax=Typha latifolia TaxID=4733 RepID=UPI003C308A47
MDAAEVEDNLFAARDAKLHRGMCKQLSSIVYKVLGVFPVLEAARPGSKPGIQALCSLHVALEKSKNLLQHCSECSKLYLAITGYSVLTKFEKARSALLNSLRRVEDIVPATIGHQILEIVNELEETVFRLDQLEKEVGDEVIQLLQKERKINSSSNDNVELEVLHQAASKLGITSSRAALTERRALKKLIERARSEEDKRKESIVAYLLHLMRKYSKIFRSEASDTDSQGSSPCSPTVLGSFEDVNGHNHGFERQLSKFSCFSFKQNELLSANISIPPEEFRCPISLHLMFDPVIISSGQTYERVCIEKWFSDGHRTCPKTQQQLSHLSLTPNYCVKGLITSWCERNGIPIPDGPPESLDLNYWRLAFSECEATDSRSMGSNKSCQSESVKVVSFEESGIIEELKLDNRATLENGSCQGYEVDEFVKYEHWLAVLNESGSMHKHHKAVEQIRFHLKDDEEARIYMGANGFAEAIVRYLRTAVCERDEKAQEVGAMALFNLAVNNNRNKGMLLSAGVIPLLEKMIVNSETCEAATALYLNLSCLDEARPIIGSSQAVPFLIRSLQNKDSQSRTFQLDALYTLYNLSTHASNIPFLVSSGIVDSLHPLLTAGITWADKALAIFICLASNPSGKNKMVSTPGLVGSIAAILDTGEPTEQEQSVSCLLILCNDDDDCSQLVLQEGVIPGLVLLSANGTQRAKEKAQKLLKLFREQRQRDLSSTPIQLHEAHQVEVQLHEVHQVETSKGGVCLPEIKSLSKSRSRKLGRALSSIWKHKNSSRNHC